jgi:uncharacterized protein (TIGR02996 family)
MSHTLRTTYRLLGLIVGIGLSGLAQGQVAINEYACGPIKTGYGPFDYRTVSAEDRLRVETYHFTPDVESLKAGSTGSTFGGDLDYTLRALPNNPRALMSLVRYDLKTHLEHANGLHYPVECYFERAIRFRPDDPTPRVIYAIYLKDRKRPAEALSQLDEAERLRGDPTNFDLDYNLGIAYFDIGEYDKAAIAAKRAYALGAPLPALRNKLQAKGKSVD